MLEAKSHVVPVFPAAVNEVLLGEADQLARGSVVHGLQGPGGGEGPAGAALALVLDGSDRPFLSPVHVLGQLAGVGRHQVLGALRLLRLVDLLVPVESGDELVMEQVTELVHGEIVGVNTLNRTEMSNKESKAMDILCSSVCCASRSWPCSPTRSSS